MKTKPIIKPFYGLHYNKKLLPKMQMLVCPPYDIINKDQEIKLKQSSEYNFCNLILTDKEHTYKKIGQVFRQWLKKEVLVQDSQPCFYLCRQKFSFHGKSLRRYGFLGLLKLDKSRIYPHEYTHKGPKADRFSIISEVQANLSPIFIIYPDTKKSRLSKVFAGIIKNKPLMNFSTQQNIEYSIWKINDSKDTQIISRAIEKKKLLIADGHHRFEVACAYAKKAKKQNGLKELDYAMAYFSPAAGKNILILPTHRVIKESRLDIVSLQKKIGEIFSFKQENSLTGLAEKIKSGKKMSLGIYCRKKFYLLRLKNKKVLGRIFKTEREKALADIDVFILHKLILKKAKIKQNENNTIYTINEEEAIHAADKYQGCAFFLKSIDIKKLINISSRGIKMPQKTTYFYPKIDAGIILRRLTNGSV